MSKKTIIIDKPLFLQIIQTLENETAFSNRSTLFEQVASHYNAQKNVGLKEITASVVYLRVKDWSIELKTPKGKRGRQKGAPVPEGFGGKGKRSRKEKFAKKPWIKQNYDAIRRELHQTNNQRFLPIVDRAEAGSMSAALKLNCLQCVCWVSAEVKQCNAVCAFLPFRPYQKAEETETEVPDEPMEEAA